MAQLGTPPSVPPAADNCSSPVEGCNEGLTLVRIIKDGNPFYSPDAGLYDSADVSYLAVKTRYGEQPTEGEVIEPASPDAASGYMIFKWREQGYSSLSPPVYQGIKYRLDTSIGWLKIAWTISNIDRTVVDNAMISLPQPQAGTACSDPVKCYRTPAGGLNFGYRTTRGHVFTGAYSGLSYHGRSTNQRASVRPIEPRQRCS